MTFRTALAPALLPVLLAACVSTGSTGGGTEQLRLTLTPDMRRAGVPEACIAQLPLSTLTQVKSITDTRASNSKAWLQQRQRIRTATQKVCGPF